MQIALQNEAPYSDIFNRFQRGAKEVQRKRKKLRIRSGMFLCHQQDEVNESAELYWRIIVPDVQDIKFTITSASHSVQHAEYPTFLCPLQRGEENCLVARDD